MPHGALECRFVAKKRSVESPQKEVQAHLQNPLSFRVPF
ncbi:hypothetical protein RISK_001212 [Rhodopirellula islandica]|uniref:Uncharacterized protein n=1 Tax=Rhodopirellula islandica TaxID=595434 RepID=A0A0J1BJM4_RHOIS|nr:hypothetical protein RISK_001212 [Rhodopirellula islandica]